LLLSPVLNCLATSHLLLSRIHECSAITITNDPLQLIIISVSEGACTALITFEQSQQPYNGQVSLVSLKLISINGLVKCNCLVDFIGIVGLDRLVRIINLSCLDDLISLVNLVKIIKLDINGRNGLIGRISIVGQVGLVGLVNLSDLGLVLSHPCFGGLISVIGFVSIVSFLGLVSLGGLIDYFSLVGSSTHWLFPKRLTASVIEATNIGLNGLDDFDDIIGLAGFDLNCLDNFNGIIGLVGFGLIGCIFIVGIIGLIMHVKLVGLVCPRRLLGARRSLVEMNDLGRIYET